MSTFCHGVASAQSLDKSGEIVDINGLDITSLPRTGILNYEHKSDIPGQICGKILTAKKIFTEKDCSNEHEAYFWNKTKTPFVYITAELLDDYCQSGKDAAGILRYDYDKKAQNKHAILGFSVEGSEIPNTRPNKMLVARGIARKVTLTSAPCNSQCVAEFLPEKKESQVKDDFESIFKSSEEAITLFKSGEGVKIYEDYLAKKETDFCDLHKALGAPAMAPSKKIPSPKGWSGKTKQGPHGTEVHFSHPEHGDVAVHKNPEGAGYHVKHNGGMANFKGVKGSFSHPADAAKHAHGFMNAVSAGTTTGNRPQNTSSPAMMGMPEQIGHKSIHKALTAGMGNAAPSTLVNGAAYQSENLSSKPATTGAEEHKFHATKKKDWNKRAKQDYQNWPHKEKFEKFMQARMPHLALGEIQAIGRTIALKKSIDMEKSLENLSGLEKGWKHAAAGAAALASLAGGHSAHAAQPDSTKYQTISHGADKTPSSTSTLNERKFGPYTVKTSYHPTSTMENGIANKGSSLTHEVTVNGPHSPEHAKAVAHEIGEKDHSKFLGMKPGSSFISSSQSHSKSGKLGKSENITKSEEPKLGNHFLFSAENPMHPHKNELKMDHKQTLAHLKSKGYNANEVKGHYGAPETSIMVHGVNPKQAGDLHGIASKLGQDSSIYSQNGKHEMLYHHGENAGKKVTGEGTTFHSEKPKDMYTTLPNGKHFTHNFNF